MSLLLHYLHLVGDGLALGARVVARSVVRGDNKQGVLLEAGLAEVFPDPADASIRVHDKVSINPDGALAFEAGFGRTRCVGSRQPDEEEKRLFLFRLSRNEFARFVAEGGQNLGVQEILGSWANPIESAPSFLSGYLALPFLSPDIGIGEHVEGAGQKKAVVESIIRRSDLDGLGKIGVLGTLDLAVLSGHAGAQVPFADVASRVSTLPEHLAHGMLAGREAQTDEAPWPTLFPFAEPEGVAPVMMEVRLGTQTESVAWALVNLIPSLQRRSKWGVGTLDFLPPKALTSP